MWISQNDGIDFPVILSKTSLANLLKLTASSNSKFLEKTLYQIVKVNLPFHFDENWSNLNVSHYIFSYFGWKIVKSLMYFYA